MFERGTRQSSSDATVIWNDSAINSDRMSFAALQEEDPYLSNLWICDVNLTDDQELFMEHLIAHLNHPRVVSLQATANALNALMPWKAVPENHMSFDTTTRSLPYFSPFAVSHGGSPCRTSRTLSTSLFYVCSPLLQLFANPFSEIRTRLTSEPSTAYPRDERDQQVMWHWMNFSSFQARTAATGLHRIIPNATWVLRAALEDFYPVTVEQ